MNTNFKQDGQSEKIEGPRVITTIPGWMNGNDVCYALRISKRTLQTYRDSRILPFSQIGRKLYYRLSDILEYLEQHHVKSTFQK